MARRARHDLGGARADVSSVVALASRSSAWARMIELVVEAVKEETQFW
jgi:hypothetical protein